MKYWKTLMTAALVLGLSACGGGEDSDKNDPPPPTPGDPGSVVFSAKAPAFVTVEVPEGTAAKQQVEKLAVDFTLKDAQGNPVDVGTTEISFSVTKLIPGRVVNNVEGPSIWKGFIYSKSKATFEKSTAGTLENLGGGNYRYLFALDFKNVLDPYPSDSADNGGIIAWDEDKLHRLSVTFGSAEEGSTMPLINYTMDWVPSGATAALTRDILEMDSCSDCHMDQPIHHSSRNDPKVCVACHNDSNPTVTARKTLAVLVHDFHSTKKAAIDSAGADVSARGADYPQDPRNCDTCHKPETPTTPNAHDWTVPTEATCKSCHSDYAAPVKDHHPGEDCRTCHADNNEGHASAGVTNVHINRLKGMQAGAATLKIDIKQASYDAATKQVTVSLNISENGAGIELDRLNAVAYMSPGLLINWDEGEGQVLPNSHSSITLKKCTGGAGDFTCVTDPITEAVPASDAVLTITVADMGLCVEKKATELDGLPAGLKACPEDGLKTISKDRFEYIAAPNIPVAHFDLSGNPADGYQYAVGAEKALCESCHKNFEIHFGGTAYDHVARDFNQCGNCHNANRASFYTGMAGDLKYHVHSYHAMGSHRGAAHAGTEDEAKALISFPGKVNNCESCHTQEQFNLPNQKNVRPSVVSKLINDQGDAIAANDERANKYYSPALVACGSCHLKSELGNVNPSAPAAGDEWADHMQDNGAVFGADTAELATGTEQCDSCHAIGQEQGVDKVHKVFDFR